MSTYTFVNSTDAGRHGPAARTAIKRQAMRDIGVARKRAGNYGKRNLRQIPVFLDTGSSPPGSKSTSSSRDDETSVLSSKSPGHHSSLVTTSHNGPETTDDRQPEHITQCGQIFTGYESLETGLAIYCPDRGSVLMLHGSEPLRHKRSTPKYEDKLQRPSYEGTVPTPSVYYAATANLNVQSPANFHLGDFERLRIEEDFDILNLSPLAGLHLGRAGIEYFTSDNFQAKAIFQQKQWSYLSYIPSRYGQTQCLSRATDCVVARLRWMLSSGYGAEETTVLSLYNKALKSLQVALNDPQQCLQPETLCATELLTLFELFDNREKHAWIRHAKGAARVIEHRGPGRFNTDFEKALFMAHAGAIVTEALLSNNSCFLEQEGWSDVFQSIILKDEPFSDRSEIVISLWTNLLTGPGMFKETTDLICTQKEPDPSTLENLINRLFYHYTCIVKWHEQWHEYTDPNACTTHSMQRKASFEPDKRLEIHGTYLSVLLLKSRLLVALSPSRFQHLETQSQALATQIMRLREGTYATSQQGGLFMTQTVWVASATMNTAKAWGMVEPGERLDGRGGMLERWRFEKWSNALGRKIDQKQ